MDVAQPMRTMDYQKRIVLVDSMSRNVSSYPSPTTYKITLPATYRNVRKARLLSVEIPNTFYVFSAAKGNTTLHLGVYDAGGTIKGPVQQVVIPDGNYTTVTICSILQTRLNEVTAFVNEGLTFTVAVDPIQFVLTVTCSPTRIVYVDTTYAGAATTGVHPLFLHSGLEYFLGFDTNKVTVSTGGVCKGSRVLQLNPYNYILLDIAELNGLDECSRTEKSVFAKVPLDGNSYEILLNNEHDCLFNQSLMNPHLGKLTTLTVFWRFTDMSPVDFNGVDHSFTLELECME